MPQGISFLILSIWSAVASCSWMGICFSRGGKLYSTIILKILSILSLWYLPLSSRYSLEVRYFHGMPEHSNFLFLYPFKFVIDLYRVIQSLYLVSIPDSLIFYMIHSVSEVFHGGFYLDYWGFHSNIISVGSSSTVLALFSHLISFISLFSFL